MDPQVYGILKPLRKGQLVLRDPNTAFRTPRFETFVPKKLEKDLKLCSGAAVQGAKKRSRNGFDLVNVDSICGLKPEEFKNRKLFRDLVAVTPSDRFQLSALGEPSMRIIDILAPIGKGTRGLIVSPPKAGKTTILQHMANAIVASAPETRVIVLLIDERPEEVTSFKRNVQAEVIASSMDQSAKEHMELAELMMDHIRVELECGKDIVVLLDSITRLGRAFNQKQDFRGRGKTMSGGLSAGAMEIPRQFFGLARKVENGGSVTIIGTALVDTGSRMDQFIFEEFKGTGNSELVLSRQLAQQRVFPAIDIHASGTRMEEKFYTPEQSAKISAVRRALFSHRPNEAIESLLKILKKYTTNEDFLASLPSVDPDA